MTSQTESQKGFQVEESINFYGLRMIYFLSDPFTAIEQTL